MLKAKKTVLLAAAVAAAAVVVLATSALSGAAGSTTPGATVKTGQALGKKVLVTRTGRTLYSLSAETKGRFICTGSCVSLWHPLLAPRSGKPTGAPSLGTVRRPSGQKQVTYRGKPLYSFAQDGKPGDAKGEGFKDVGVWHVAAIGSASTPAPTPAPQSTSPAYSY
jgi:predicted lipoprotein with Yx(FWY)xxD motif